MSSLFLSIAAHWMAEDGHKIGTHVFPFDKALEYFPNNCVLSRAKIRDMSPMFQRDAGCDPHYQIISTRTMLLVGDSSSLNEMWIA